MYGQAATRKTAWAAPPALQSALSASLRLAGGWRDEGGGERRDYGSFSNDGVCDTVGDKDG